MSEARKITIQHPDEHEYSYLITLAPAEVTSNLMIRASREGDYIETKLTLLAHIVGDAAIGTYVGERSTILFEGQLFLRNDTDTWTYLESVIASGLTPAQWETYFDAKYGGYYNFVEVITNDTVAISTEINEKYVSLEPYLVNNDIYFDYAFSYK